jgi:hypothetical protein
MKKGELLKQIKARGCVFVKHGKNTMFIKTREPELKNESLAIMI